jgi:hypothetical protein
MSDRVIKITTAAVVVTVAIVAGMISFSHLFDLAHAHGQSGVAARLTPVSVDATILAASLVMLHSARRQIRSPWLARVMLGAGVGATIAGNLAYGLKFGAIGALISAWPGCALIGCMELIVNMIRTGRQLPEPEHQEVPIPLIHRTFAGEIARGETPTVRTVKTVMQLGQQRAMWVRDYLASLSEVA